MRMSGDASDVLKKLEQVYQRIVAENEKAMENTAKAVTESVQVQLRASILRPNESDGTLEKSITGEVRKSGSQIMAGIGNIEKMTQAAPYWQAIDQGSGHMVGKYIPGWFDSVSGGRVAFDKSKSPLMSPSYDVFLFMPHASGGSFMHVRRPIRPKYYFEAGRMAVEQKVNGFFQEGFRRAFSR